MLNLRDFPWKKVKRVIKYAFFSFVGFVFLLATINSIIYSDEESMRLKACDCRYQLATAPTNRMYDQIADKCGMGYKQADDICDRRVGVDIN